jgi:hypothetical protein
MPVRSLGQKNPAHEIYMLVMHDPGVVILFIIATKSIPVVRWSNSAERMPQRSVLIRL